MNDTIPGYSIDNNVLWYVQNLSGDFGSKWKVEKADLATLKIFNRVWAKDAKNVWADGMDVRKVYAPAFEALNAAFGRDNECVFDSLGRIVKDVNPATFEALDTGLERLADRRTLRIASYARCDGKIYHYDSTDHKTMCQRGADAHTFEVLKWGYARDIKKVFLGQYVLAANPQRLRQITNMYCTDDRKVFYDRSLVPEADPATFEFIGGQYWARDKGRVYFQFQMVPGADPATARVIGDMLADAANVFEFATGKAVAGLEAASVQHLGSRYYRDRSRIYCGLGGGFIEGADRETFEKLPAKHPSRGDAWDKNWIYRGETRLRPRSEFQEST